MYQFFIVGAIFLIGLGFYLWDRFSDNYEDKPPTWAFIFISIAFAYAAMIGVDRLVFSNNIYNFMHQRQYLINHIPKNTIEDATLTAQKIKLNEWLFKVQFNKDQFKEFSIYPDWILDEKPIE